MLRFHGNTEKFMSLIIISAPQSVNMERFIVFLWYSNNAHAKATQCNVTRIFLSC